MELLDRLTDSELLVAVATEVFHWQHVWIDSSGTVRGYPRRGLVTVALSLSNFIRDPASIDVLEDYLQRCGLRDEYCRHLESYEKGNGGQEVTPRQKCEIAIAVSREAASR